MSFKQVESRKLGLINRSVPSCDSILDLGAGDGAYLPHLARKAERVIAIEINRGLCSLIKADGFEVVLADARFIPFKGNAFDCVWASEIVEHTPSFNMIEEVERVARQTIVITMPNPWSPHYKRDATHVLKYSLFGLSRYLKARRKNSEWSYKLRGLGFYWVPLPGFAKKLTSCMTYYLPFFSPTVYIVGRREIKGGGLMSDGNSKKYWLSTAPIIKIGLKLVPSKLKPKIIPLLLRYRRFLWAGSTVISFVPTYVCNYQCPYCFIHTKFNYAQLFPRSTEHSWEEWVQAFDRFPPAFIHITGGEPLCYPDLIPLLENMPKKHTILAIATNLTLHIDEFSNILSRRFFISTSFHSHMTDKESFRERVLKMRGAGFPVSVSVVAYPDRIAFLPELKRYFEDAIGVRFVVNPYLDPFYKYSKEEAAIVKKYVPSRVKIGWEGDTRPKTCVAGSKYFQFLPNGDVYTCLSGIYYATSNLHEGICENPKRFYLGNLFEGSFKPLEGPTTCSCPCSERCDQGYGRVKPI